MNYYDPDGNLKNFAPRSFEGFSLIELSVVVLIIGLLIAGVIAGKRLVTLSNLSKARALTNSSPVAGIEDLALWLETTSKNSFITQPSDGSTVSIWKDINPQLNTKNNATALGAPIYVENSINGLPAIRFNGVDSGMTEVVSFTGPKLTIFTVYKRLYAAGTTPTNASMIGFNTPGNQDYDDVGRLVVANEADEVTIAPVRNFVYYSTVTHPASNIPFIYGVKFDGANVVSYYNGVAGSSNASTGNFNTTQFNAGQRNQNYFYNGDLGEVIVYTRDLSDFERNQIEQYLSKKWGIKLS